jgi:hypothetical protein
MTNVELVTGWWSRGGPSDEREHPEVRKRLWAKMKNHGNTLSWLLTMTLGTWKSFGAASGKSRIGKLNCWLPLVGRFAGKNWKG